MSEPVRRDWCEEHNRGSLADTDGVCPDCDERSAKWRSEHAATTLPDDTEPSAEALAILSECNAGRPVITGPKGELFVSRETALLALDRFRAAEVREERPFEKIAGGLRGALQTTKLAGEIIDLLPEGVATRDLFHQIIAILAPHISEPPHDL